ncbi:hypothetical protein, partial [Pseudomonas silensiensis]|uniref:hypothetical protein n=1 Tax=Pseudomonas silensiensis TaxID=2991049 RepID=UPI003D1A7E13
RVAVFKSRLNVGASPYIAAGEACVRLRSSRKTCEFNLPERTAVSEFTTASQPNAGYASCYKGGAKTAIVLRI